MKEHRGTIHAWNYVPEQDYITGLMDDYTHVRTSKVVRIFCDPDTNAILCETENSIYTLEPFTYNG